MRQIKYNYKIVQRWIDTHPVIKFYLQGKKKSVPLFGLVDTGAYFTTLHSYFANEAGIDLSYAVNQNIDTANGIIKGKKVNVFLKFIDEFTNESFILKTDVVFLDTLNFTKEAVLIGRAGIFNKFNEVSFSENTFNKNIKFKF
ncbi:MAG: hypothetical protein WC358_07385 [Ignavibacteria bacterium]|jgi:hypothetical protein